ncbi:hypothetical protein Tco_0701390 [Tanacetum coccineum]
MPTYRTAVVDAAHNDEELRLNLDLLEERRERAAIREAKAKLKMTKYYNARVRGVTFRPGDFVYRSNDASHAVDGGKLGPKWEGPYEVTEALGDGAYRLRSMDGTVLLRTLSRSIRQQDSKTLRGNANIPGKGKRKKITFQVYAAKRDDYMQDNESTKATLAMDALSQLLLPFEFELTISAIATLFVYLGRDYGGAKYPVVPKTRAEIKPLSFSGLILTNPKSDTRILVYLKSRCMIDGMEVIVERERNDHVTAVKADTLKLIVQIRKTPKLSSPFPDEHLSLTLGETSIEGKPIQMMEVPQEEVERVILKLLSFGLFELLRFQHFSLVDFDGYHRVNVFEHFIERTPRGPFELYETSVFLNYTVIYNEGYRVSKASSKIRVADWIEFRAAEGCHRVGEVLGFEQSFLILKMSVRLQNMFDPKGIISWSVARVDWSEHEWHMKSYAKGELKLKDVHIVNEAEVLAGQM